MQPLISLIAAYHADLTPEILNSRIAEVKTAYAAIDLSLPPAWISEAQQILSSTHKYKLVTTIPHRTGLLIETDFLRKMGGFAPNLGGGALLEDLIARVRGIAGDVLLERPLATGPTRMQYPAPVLTDPEHTHRILVFSPYGEWQIHEQVNFILAATAAVRGSDVRIIRCDGSFRDNCYVLVRSTDKPTDCRNCLQMGDTLFNALGLPTEYLSSILTQSDWQRARSWADALAPESYAVAEFDGAPVGQCVTPFVCSYFQVGPRSLSLPNVRALHRAFLEYSAATWLGMGRYFASYKPTRAIMYQGAGMVQSIVAHLCATTATPMLAHERSRFPGAFMYSSNEITSAFHIRKELGTAWRDIPLSETEADWISRYLAERRTGKNSNYQTFYTYTTDSASVRDRLNIPRGAVLVGAFTSAEYEKVYFGEYKHLPSQTEILRNLIEVFRHREEYLVIRQHPNIGGGKDGRWFDGELLGGMYELMRDLPPNVRMIPPDEELTSYSLLWQLDACFGFFSTVGLEAIASGVPTAIVEESVYSPGATHLLTDYACESLERTLDDLLDYRSMIGAHDLRRVYRYMYTLVSRIACSLEGVKLSPNGVDIRVRSIEELAPGRCQGLDRLLAHLYSGGPLYDLPDHSHLGRSDNSEQKIIHVDWNTIAETRQSCRLASATGIVPDKKAPIALIGSATALMQPFAAGSRRGITVTGIEAPSILEDRSVVDSLRSAITASAHEWFLFATDRFTYDEAIFSALGNTLSEARACTAVRCGAWVADDSSAIRGYVFFGKDKPYSYEKIRASIMPTLPLELVATTVLSKRAAIEILEMLAVGIREEALTRRLYELITSAEVLELDSPIGAFSAPRNSEH